jgi:hypothetical protein
MERVLEEVQRAMDMRFDATLSSSVDDQPGLWIAAERWTKEGSNAGDGDGVALVITHANGFTKEVSGKSASSAWLLAACSKVQTLTYRRAGTRL